MDPLSYEQLPAVRFIEVMGGPVLVLVGETITLETGQAAIQTAPGTVHAIPEGYRAAVDFMRTPRSVSHVTDFKNRYGLRHKPLNLLEDAGAILRIKTSTPLKAADGFKGVRLVAQSVKGGPAGHGTTLVAVHRDADAEQDMYVTEALAAVLWDLEAPVDLPKAIRLVDDGAGPELTARRVLTNLPNLLSLRLARLERVDT
ncbi:hypothetical protein [Arthrobacter caoxuetaonis]|uniref:Uncharacterized protein n=1 Tax=Arthrobacter caoxuetaonis TaxID=2886935 RepID=A0A9X1SD94_9MICC|nr:hypothetical protein [Arthrobacter caoxuetaonis]MCC3299410.1 hypothetical protein [Arthrobacter caoxuetaonis]USQ59097.1 hypothetical protein NF551_18500 [Arthrobacter caoxuetaonis]